MHISDVKQHRKPSDGHNTAEVPVIVSCVVYNDIIVVFSAI